MLTAQDLIFLICPIKVMIGKNTFKRQISIFRCGLDKDYRVYVLEGTRFRFFFFFFYTRFSWRIEVTVHTVRLLFTHCFVLFTHFSTNFSLKMGPMALFTHLKIILLQYFQFSAKISCIQTDLNWIILFIFFIYTDLIYLFIFK